MGVQSFEFFTGFFPLRAVLQLSTNYTVKKKLHNLISANQVATTRHLFGLQVSYYLHIEKAIVTVRSQVVAKQYNDMPV